VATAGPVLAFDTSGPFVTAALVADTGVLALAQEDLARGQAERLFPLLEALLSDAGFGWRDLAGIGVGIGPGNFTGIRIAVAAARGLALSLGRPAIGVSRLEAQALDLPRPLASTVAAPRGAVYLQCFTETAAATPLLAGEADLAALPAGLAVVGDGAALVAPRTGGPVLGPVHPLPVALALIAAGRLDRPAPRPAPLYLKPADAAPSRDAPPPRIG
jgi:tRNA threonylcarbamoyl adenosine modification protein YeaZ